MILKRFMRICLERDIKNNRVNKYLENNRKKEIMKERNYAEKLICNVETSKLLYELKIYDKKKKYKYEFISTDIEELKMLGYKGENLVDAVNMINDVFRTGKKPFKAGLYSTLLDKIEFSVNRYFKNRLDCENFDKIVMMKYGKIFDPYQYNIYFAWNAWKFKERVFLWFESFDKLFEEIKKKELEEDKKEMETKMKKGLVHTIQLKESPSKEIIDNKNDYRPKLKPHPEYERDLYGK